MEPLSNLIYLVEPASLALMITAVTVVTLSAQRALIHAREVEKHKDLADQQITLDQSQALMIPVVSSCSLLVMFYLFSSISQLVTGFTALAATTSLVFALTPVAHFIAAKVGLLDYSPLNCCGGFFTKVQLGVLVTSILATLTWLVTGNWLLNNLLGVGICVAFVSYVRLPSIRICTILLACLFLYDIFWVFFSSSFFGSNVMVSVATQQAKNPIHTVSETLHIPVSATVVRNLDLPVKLIFPRSLLEGTPIEGSRDYMMLGLGDMAIPGMLLALVLCFDHQKEGGEAGLRKERVKGRNYFWQACCGYACGLVAALSAGLLMQAAQPALLYLVPSTLGPVTLIAWSRGELPELWNGSRPSLADKGRELEV